jgi:pimeloyl-ACP methyl ester carboxylesterase
MSQNRITAFNRKTANIHDGITYIDQGKGIPILFLHGTLSNADTWRKIIPTLSEKYRCIAIDLPIGGHSIALNKSVNLTPTGIAKLIKQFLEFLNIDKAIIVSNDTGGAYAQIFASLYPENVEKLVFSNCEVLNVFPPTKFKYLVKAVKLPGFTYLLSRFFKIKNMLKSDMMMGLLSHKVTNNELSELYLKTFINDKDIRRNFTDNAKTWSPKYTIEAAEKLKKETFRILILWGEDDKKLFPVELGQQLKKIFNNATLIQIPSSKTYVQEDQPETMIKEIKSFLDN